MANNYLVNPIRIDTAMTSSFKALTSASIGAFNTLLIKKVWNLGILCYELLVGCKPFKGEENKVPNKRLHGR